MNKVDSFEKFGNDVYEFYNLGIGDPIPISAASRLGLGELLDAVAAHFPEDAPEEEEDERPRIAIVGKPNVGKSSIVNKLLGENRVIVSDIAGTTRDAVDTEIVHNGTEYVFIDTAGLRRKNKIKEELERYSIIRAVTAIERADVVLVVIDAQEGVTEQDAKIAGIAHERGKGIIVAVNKWDAVEKTDKTIYEYTNRLKTILSFMPYAQYLFVSALTGQRLLKLYDMIDLVRQNQTLRVATGVLNEIMSEAVALQQPPSDKGKRLKLYYITQVSVKPPTFVMHLALRVRRSGSLSGSARERSSEYGTDCVCGSRLCVWPASVRLSVRENEKYGYPPVRERQRRLHECAARDGQKGGPHRVLRRFLQGGPGHVPGARPV